MRRKPNDEIARMLDEFESIRQDMLRLIDDSADLLADIHPQHQFSARNLLHYLALRSRDLRPLQTRLAAVGLSSLGRAESNVLAAVDAVRLVLQRLTSSRSDDALPVLGPVDPVAGQRLLDAHTEAVLGIGRADEEVV